MKAQQRTELALRRYVVQQQREQHWLHRPLRPRERRRQLIEACLNLGWVVRAATPTVAEIVSNINRRREWLRRQAEKEG